MDCHTLRSRTELTLDPYTHKNSDGKSKAPPCFNISQSISQMIFQKTTKYNSEYIANAQITSAFYVPTLIPLALDTLMPLGITLAPLPLTTFGPQPNISSASLTNSSRRRCSSSRFARASSSSSGSCMTVSTHAILQAPFPAFVPPRTRGLELGTGCHFARVG